MLISTGQKKAGFNKYLRAAFTLIEVMIAFLIFGLVSGGLLYGYVQANRIAEWSSMSLGAQSYASQGIEQARAAKWDSEANGEVTADFLPANPVTNYFQVDTNDVPQSGAPLLLTNYISITNIYSTPPLLRQITSRVVWQFPLTGKMFTNTLITLRAPDQ
jgi:type II secretory pathway pseudopilin PulG